ncbi:MAG: cytidylate kinase family protein [Acidobacteria bacterium]|nr:cytidylate kinase family protein [Acidobacteriota bacterium]
MAVITISRGSFSGGTRLAECVASRLGYRCIDRDVIVTGAAAYGASENDLRDALEKPPTLWERFKHTKYMYLALIQAALTEEVRAGNAVYHGNAGHLLLEGISHVMRVRIIAPRAFRLEAVQTRLKMSEAEASAYIQKMDEDRRMWTQYLYEVDWRDASFYDLVLNLERLDIFQACDIIAAMARQECFQETPESRAAIDDLALASRIQANLAVTPATVDLEVDVTAHAGAVVVRGHLSAPDQTAFVRAVVAKVPGVKQVAIELFAGLGA